VAQIPRGILLTSFAVSAAVSLASGPARAQSGPGWFVPNHEKPGAATAGRPPGPARVAPESEGGEPGVMPMRPEGEVPMVGGRNPALMPMSDVKLPPMPEIPPIPKGSPTPAAIIGVLSVPDVLRVSTAYQEANKEFGARRDKLNEDARKEQNALRELGQTFANERAKLTPEQIRQKEKEYADRVNDSRRKFSERDRINQEAGQYVMMQINRVIEQVAQQVAASRGINLVLSRGQVLGTTSDFDLTPEVAAVVNKVMPTVVIPPPGVSPVDFTAPAAGPRAGAAKPHAAPPKKH
jgi:Skp family chaperone for outer membrane proteins